MAQSYAFRIAGIAPTGDPEWHAAGEDVHRAFWSAVVRFVCDFTERHE